MVEEGTDSYDFYVKNFPYIKFMLDEKHINQDKNILLLIFYDNDLYKKYLFYKKENDFIKLIQNYFLDVEIYNNEEYGIFMIKGDIFEPIYLIIKNIFNEDNYLDDKKLDNLGIEKIMKNNYCFFISLIKIYFCDTKGKMNFIFNAIKSNYSNEEN